MIVDLTSGRQAEVTQIAMDGTITFRWRGEGAYRGDCSVQAAIDEAEMINTKAAIKSAIEAMGG